ncbi:hypothetical protein WK54_07695 [Burkholderia ubonensis]|nr:hypothetical protein WK54_07695 [Burkholderia ubonensis]
MQRAAWMRMTTQKHTQARAQSLLFHVPIRRQFLLTNACEDPLRTEDQLQRQQPPKPPQRIPSNEMRSLVRNHSILLDRR